MRFIVGFVISTIVLMSCQTGRDSETVQQGRIPVVFDTDANNELDDQHALAYLLLNDSVFDVKGITVNATYNGGGIEDHYAEAERVVELCAKADEIEILKGAEGPFETITPLLIGEFDGWKAINFIIDEAKKVKDKKLVVLAVGKLTNVAVAVKKDPSIIGNIRLVWLGSNYPKHGEYNLENDVLAMNYLLETEIEFEMVVCRYGESSGTDAVRVTQSEIVDNMLGAGPQISDSVVGRHGKVFTCFGDYSVDLFKHAEYYEDPPSRALFDMAAVAIVKNPQWAHPKSISAPSMIDGLWVDHPGNKRKIIIWENFKTEYIISDFYSVFE